MVCQIAEKDQYPFREKPMFFRIPVPRLRVFLLVMFIAVLPAYVSSFAVSLGLRPASGPRTNISVALAVITNLPS